MYRRSLLFGFVSAVFLIPVAARADDLGFMPEMSVQHPTRLDWTFVAAGFGEDATRLPRNYRSDQQRYQLFVPPEYSDKKTWPLVVFISSGDDPLGWRSWQKTCEDGGIFFCAAYGAGNNQPAGVRTRIVLDMLDDVRRRHRIDPEQTYFAGLSGGGQLASALGLGLPEQCGGVVLIAATPAAPRLEYLRHRAQDRLSVAFITGERDASRHELEANWQPFYKDIGIRSRLWSAKTSPSLPPSEVVAEVHAWLTEDLPRRRKEREARPKLAVKPEEAVAAASQATRMMETAQAEMVLPGKLHRAIVLMEGIEARWPKTDAAEKAHALVRSVRSDLRLKLVLAEQAGVEERLLLSAEARGRERLGDVRGALTLYEKLSAAHADSDEGKKAVEETKRLREALANTPYLGAAFEEDGTIRAVAPQGPAHRAGLQVGDRVLQVGATRVTSLADLRRVLQTLKPGDRTMIEVRRDGKPLTVTVEVTAAPFGR